MSSKKYLLWIMPKKTKSYFLSEKELFSSTKLVRSRKADYMSSRSSLREVLSLIFNLDPLKVPLDGEFGRIPSIPPEYGYISLSHCDNALLIGWSIEKIGVDIERIDRRFNAKGIMKRFYLEDEIKELNLIKNSEEFRKEVMKLWVTKESSLKWSQDTIASDLLNWQIKLLENKAFNKSLNLNLNAYCLKYKNWFLGAASKFVRIDNTYPLICDMF
ncbi:4'-phosphopantetheinyl transferase superfamily protein [uncultured Prochlorococcus sp.]|uniref:4'-phosphopantetheinyl transferase family protein n=1 Tax=uncultured Prochlorococcus sp. TaxID=159733 RepID=UPI0025906224|nr:4'-phosphopantetheinyl transferase superfamily protein [uncultured Prochlorococcus sp.]